ELYYGPGAPLPLMAYDRRDGVLLAGSVSQTMLPGLRLGWLAGPGTVVERLAEIKMQMDDGCCPAAQQMLLRLLREGEYIRHLERLRAALRERRDHMAALLEREMSGLAAWRLPAGGPFFWLRMREGVCMERVFRRCAQEGLLFCPGDMFGGESGAYLRLSFSRADMEEAARGIGILAKAVRQELSVKQDKKCFIKNENTHKYLDYMSTNA
ncbi:MAG: aminotransferase class I/II-fold pyridoxal phosphate-dependent enzyme, partial [Clostridia bacterium]|nr:aminotransferase class I/II-fold pyridoxal phosphate-dependent enzyme [Clostridia bacterium]